MLTAIVVTLGDDPRLPPCLAALERAARVAGLESQLELAVVENAVEGEGPPLAPAPALRLRREANPGFAGAFNEALAATRGSWVLSLNADAQLEPDALRAALAALRDAPEAGAIAFRLVRPGGATLDSAGIRLGLVRRARDRGMGQTAAGRFTEAEGVDAACMAAALFRREALESARDGAGEVLDSRFFAYKEDVDLGWRLRRAGWRILYEPRAVAVHERGWKEGARHAVPAWLRILSFRNRWLMIAKNESALSFVLRLALYVPMELALAAWLLVREPRVLRAYRGILAGLGESLRRRPLVRTRP